MAEQSKRPQFWLRVGLHQAAFEVRGHPALPQRGGKLPNWPTSRLAATTATSALLAQRAHFSAAGERLGPAAQTWAVCCWAVYRSCWWALVSVRPEPRSALGRPGQNRAQGRGGLESQGPAHTSGSVQALVGLGLKGNAIFISSQK